MKFHLNDIYKKSVISAVFLYCLINFSAHGEQGGKAPAPMCICSIQCSDGINYGTFAGVGKTNCSGPSPEDAARCQAACFVKGLTLNACTCANSTDSCAQAQAQQYNQCLIGGGYLTADQVNALHALCPSKWPSVLGTNDPNCTTYLTCTPGNPLLGPPVNICIGDICKVLCTNAGFKPVLPCPTGSYCRVSSGSCDYDGSGNGTIPVGDTASGTCAR